MDPLTNLELVAAYASEAAEYAYADVARYADGLALREAASAAREAANAYDAVAKASDRTDHALTYADAAKAYSADADSYASRYAALPQWSPRSADRPTLPFLGQSQRGHGTLTPVLGRSQGQPNRNRRALVSIPIAARIEA